MAGGGRKHAPMVVGRIGGLTTRLVLDTGSEVHLLTRELADELGLPVHEGEQGTDHGGAPVRSWEVGELELALGEVEVRLRRVVAIPAPPPFPPWGIGGILSPQHLHPSEWAVLDLVADELLLVDTSAEALTAWLDERAPGGAVLSLARDERFPGVVVPAAVAPHPEIPTMLNTGGGCTEFARAAVPGLAEGEQERLGGGVSGEDVVGTWVGEATLAVGGRRLRIPSLAVREAVPEPQGLVGMDVLAGTILAVAADRTRPVLWRLPG